MVSEIKPELTSGVASGRRRLLGAGNVPLLHLGAGYMRMQFYQAYH